MIENRYIDWVSSFLCSWKNSCQFIKLSTVFQIVKAQLFFWQIIEVWFTVWELFVISRKFLVSHCRKLFKLLKSLWIRFRRSKIEAFYYMKKLHNWAQLKKLSSFHYENCLKSSKSESICQSFFVTMRKPSVESLTFLENYFEPIVFWFILTIEKQNKSSCWRWENPQSHIVESFFSCKVLKTSNPDSLLRFLPHDLFATFLKKPLKFLRYISKLNSRNIRVQ